MVGFPIEKAARRIDYPYLDNQSNKSPRFVAQLRKERLHRSR